MAFPVSPTNGQQSTIANIVYQYASATNSWTVVPGYANVISATGTITSAANVYGSNVVATTAVSAPSIVGTTVSVTGNVTGGNITPTGAISLTGNIYTGNILTNGYYYANGTAFAGGGGGGTPGGSNTYVQFNDNGAFGATSGFTFNKTTNAVGVSGNVTGGNLLTGGLISATSTITSGANITGGNLLTGGLISATSNITGGNILTGGIISATGNVSGGNLAAATAIFSFGTVYGTANVTGGNILTGGLISATGNVSGGNLLTGGLVSATGTITSKGNITNGDGTTAAPQLYYINAANTQYAATLIQRVGSERWLIGADNSTANGNIVIRFNATTNYVTVTEAGIVSVAGNVSAGNLLTGGLISATGNITGGNVLGGANVNATTHTGTTVSVSGNITGGNILTGGLISATGNITGGNVLGGANVNATTHTGTTVSVTGAINGGAITGTSLTVSTGNITGGNIVNAGANGVGNIGTVGGYFNTVFAKATSAQYADLAEMYVADQTYTPGTVVIFGGTKEITITNTSHDARVAGIISTNPSYLMNSEQQGEHVLPVALTGRVPCRILGPVQKGDRLVASDIPGVAQVLDTAQFQPGCIVGKSLEDFSLSEVGTIEVAVGRT